MRCSDFERRLDQELLEFTQEFGKMFERCPPIKRSAQEARDIASETLDFYCAIADKVKSGAREEFATLSVLLRRNTSSEFSSPIGDVQTYFRQVTNYTPRKANGNTVE